MPSPRSTASAATDSVTSAIQAAANGPEAVFLQALTGHRREPVGSQLPQPASVAVQLEGGNGLRHGDGDHQGVDGAREPDPGGVPVPGEGVLPALARAPRHDLGRPAESEPPRGQWAAVSVQECRDPGDQLAERAVTRPGEFRAPVLRPDEELPAQPPIGGRPDIPVRLHGVDGEGPDHGDVAIRCRHAGDYLAIGGETGVQVEHSRFGHLDPQAP